jgi:hypothetical protein
MRYVSTTAGDRERRLGLRSRATIIPSPSQQTVLDRPPAARPIVLRRPMTVRRRVVGVVGRPRSAMQWAGTPATRVERRTRAAATPWHG